MPKNHSQKSKGRRMTAFDSGTTMRDTILTALLLSWACGAAADASQTRSDGAAEFSGIYPHLAHFNSSNECGTGGVVPWADRLWVITYSPHSPGGSDDKLYEINQALDRTTRPESVGGTPANRMIHRESGQLLIGPYVIDRQRRVRVISPQTMFGRLTGNARHLTDPANKVYYATMEEGFYEVDVRKLKVTELYPDANRPGSGGIGGKLLPGYHGKGLYSGQGRLVYANNGERSSLALSRPDIASGALASWDGRQWTVVRRNQFTEVTGPGGLYGNADPESDPVWSIGWDHRSLILMLLDGGKWHSYRLPKATHTYDGAHGWNTEWPRIRDVGERDLLMTMHGTFWRFPRQFRRGHTAGIAPRSTYLKVIGDFCRFNDRLVFGCDDAAKSEFLNKRKAKGRLAAPGQSQSNLWFLPPERLDRLGPPLGRGAVWVDDEVKAGELSVPFLFGGYERRGLHLAHDAEKPVKFHLEVDRQGDGTWTPLQQVVASADGYRFVEFSQQQTGAWIRLAVDRDCRATAWFEFRNVDRRSTEPDKRFDGLALAADQSLQGGLLRAGSREVGLQVLASRTDDEEIRTVGYYQLRTRTETTSRIPKGTVPFSLRENRDSPQAIHVRVLSPSMELQRVDSPEREAWMVENVAIPKGVLQLDSASVLYVDEKGRRFRLPVGNPVYFDRPGLLDLQRADREVCTERDLFQCAGTFFELPAKNAGGFAKIRPIATHPYFVHDYCSWRGLLVLSGTTRGLPQFSRSENGAVPLGTPETTRGLSQFSRSENGTVPLGTPETTRGLPQSSRSENGAVPLGTPNRHILRSPDGRCAVWLGAIDDLWSLGKPVGRGGPWKDTEAKAGQPSDAYLMAGYDRKTLTLSHKGTQPVTFDVQLDITGTGNWQTYQTFEVPVGEAVVHQFPDVLGAYWVRLVPSTDAVATAQLRYE